MRLIGPSIQPLREELDVMREKIDFCGATVLEIGCGAATRTEQIALHTDVKAIVAAEIDAIAHNKNLGKQVNKVRFESFGAQQIPYESESFDVVIMLKSLHHVPGTMMKQSLSEIHRVLKMGGLAYLSEPVFQGDLNEVIRMFHDEEAVREAAFESIGVAISSGLFSLQEEYFYLSPVRMESFKQFQQAIMNATYQEHQSDDRLVNRVRERFEGFRSVDEKNPFYFETPNRVDLLRKI